MSKLESSILMSTFNNETTIRSSVKSILSQSYKNYELLIMDDNSSDLTGHYLAHLSKEDSRIKIFKNVENLGLTKSLNILINHSHGSLIFRQDADDISLPNRLKKQVDVLKNSKYDICVTRAVTAGSLKRIPNKSYFLPYKLVMKYKNPFIHGTLGMKREVLINVGKYDEDYYFSQDYHLYRKFIQSSYKIYKIRDIHYVLNTDNNISTNSKNKQKEYFNRSRKQKIV